MSNVHVYRLYNLDADLHCTLTSHYMIHGGIALDVFYWSVICSLGEWNFGCKFAQLCKLLPYSYTCTCYSYGTLHVIHNMLAYYYCKLHIVCK